MLQISDLGGRWDQIAPPVSGSVMMPLDVEEVDQGSRGVHHALEARCFSVTLISEFLVTEDHILEE